MQNKIHINTLKQAEEEGEIPVAAVSDENGKILWIYTNELEVLEVDGETVKELLK